MIVDCDFRKWRESPHWRFPARLIERDAHGTWLIAEPPTPYSGPRGTGEWTHRFVILIPPDDWWIASFNDPAELPEPVEIYVDICTPAEWLTPTHVQAIDLDLDVIRFADGRTIIDDEDEFLEHQVTYAYPPDVIREARDACDRIAELVAARGEPFGAAGAEMLQRPVFKA